MMMADLPDDILADLLGRLSPRDQASSRCVCQAWRGVIDARRLLRADLLPLTLRGIFLVDEDYVFPPLFSRPSTTTGPAICDNLDDFIAANDMDSSPFCGHCNGLLLFWRMVVNPATGRWARFPSPPPLPPPFLADDQGGGVFDHEAVLGFDPTVSPHYAVFLVPTGPMWQLLINPDSEWPPSPFVLRVFSSSTGRWEERLLERETHGLATMGTVAHIREQEKRVHDQPLGCYGTFYRGRLYVQCLNGFVTRINTSSGTYHLFKRPMGIDARNNHQIYIGKSKDGVYYASVDYRCRLRVWYLDESHSQLKWVLKCDTCLNSVLPPRKNCCASDKNNGPWFLRCYADNRAYDKHLGEEIGATELEWSSDMEDFQSKEGPHCKTEFIMFLGFHPYKEVVFLHQSSDRGIAYHLNSSKIQDLGSIDYRGSTVFIYESFPYTPCWIGNL